MTLRAHHNIPADAVTDLTVTKLRSIKKNYVVAISVTAGLQKKAIKYLMPFEVSARVPLWKKQWLVYVKTTGCA